MKIRKIRKQIVADFQTKRNIFALHLSLLRDDRTYVPQPIHTGPVGPTSVRDPRPPHNQGKYRESCEGLGHDQDDLLCHFARGGARRQDRVELSLDLWLQGASRTAVGHRESSGGLSGKEDFPASWIIIPISIAQHFRQIYKG